MSKLDHDVTGALERVRTAMRRWVLDLALPFWCAHGFNADARSADARPAIEMLSLSGAPLDPGFTRIRVQARQLYVCSIGAELGVPGAAERAAGLFRFLVRHARVHGDGWARRLTPIGDPLDPTIDLYDVAFVLFGFAHHARVSGDPQPLAEAARTLAMIRGSMSHPAGGFLNTLPSEAGWRLQNPHMHLLEASQALFEASGAPLWSDLARDLASLFHERLFDPSTGTLAECFTETWQRAGGIDGDSTEPGHHAEWIWLLDRQEALFGRHPNTDAAINGLWRIRNGAGVGMETGLVRDETDRHGRLLRGTSRLWPQTEYLRAASVLYRRATDPADREQALYAVVRTAENLMERFLVGAGSTTPPPGTWVDQLDAFGLPMVRTIPTSSFYHIMTAWLELDALGALPRSVAGPAALG